MSLPIRLPESLRSSRSLGALAAIASLALLARSVLAFEPPRPISIAPSIKRASPHALLRQLREIYPEDIYPNGAYFHTPWGEVRYWIVGQDGPRVVLIHGLSIPSLVWRKVVHGLVQRGYQVLVYDLFGRGYTDAPNVPYTPALYTTQLALLLQHVQWKKAHIIGLSMGGAIATAFAADHPELVDGDIVLIAPVGLIEPEELGLGMVFLSSRVARVLLSSSLVKLFYNPVQKAVTKTQGVKAADADTALVARLVALQSMVLPGFSSALASSLRDGPLTGLEWAYSRAAATGVRVLHIHGDKDTAVPYESTARNIQALVPQAVLVKVEGAGHDVCFDDRYVPRLLDELDAFLRAT
ncbi:alpha/beta-hydrolase [Auricularia subglabra TFB-10046 SS5]|nr:alpha/beta-hydrolase [Auricularia subglabra TFB-10046 SS5]